jgi:rhomboid protease GluP
VLADWTREGLNDIAVVGYPTYNRLIEAALKALWFRILIAWYRLLGASAVQAEWKARNTLKQPDVISDRVRYEVGRVNDSRFNCVCGQLLVVGDKVCHQCNRRQLMPFRLRRILRWIGVGSGSGSGSPGTMFLFAITAIAFVVQVRYGNGGIMSPNTTADFYELGAAHPIFTNGPQPWRAFTYSLLHGGLMHIFFNCFVLMQLGPLIERTFGTSRFLFSYVVAGAAAVIIPSIVWGANDWTVGASGSIFGLIGMAMIYGHRLGTSQGRSVRDEMIKWTVYTTIFGLLMPLRIAHGAHFAGLGAGIVLGLILTPAGGRRWAQRLSGVLAVSAIGIMLYSVSSLILWSSAGAKVPLELPPAVRLSIYVEFGNVFGTDRFLDSDGKGLMKKAEDLVSRPTTNTQWAVFVDEMAQVISTKPMAEGEYIRRVLAEYLRANKPELFRVKARPSSNRGPTRP